MASEVTDPAAPPPVEARHFVLFKPYGYLSQFRSEAPWEVKKKRFLGELHDFPPGTMAVGRLDEASEGLLLLTTDGQFSERLRRPDVEKEYYVQVDGQPTETALAQLRQGVEISLQGQRYHTQPCRVRALPAAPALPPRPRPVRDDRHGPTTWLSIIVTEGKFRQVRKMTAVVGLPTLRLVRVRVGEIGLGGLLPGQVRELTGWPAFASTNSLLSSAGIAGI